MKTEPPRLIFPSMAAAASASGIPYSLLKAWKAAGVAGFDANGRVNLPIVLQAIFATENADIAAPPGMRSWREALLKAQAGRQQLRLEQERGRLVEKAWVAARIQEAAGEINRSRIRSEAEHPTRFAAAGGDVAECRSVLRGIWDDLFCAIQSAAAKFSESPDEKAM